MLPTWGRSVAGLIAAASTPPVGWGERDLGGVAGGVYVGSRDRVDGVVEESMWIRPTMVAESWPSCRMWIPAPAR